MCPTACYSLCCVCVHPSSLQAGSEGSMLIGLVREGRTTITEHQNQPTDTVPGTIALATLCVFKHSNFPYR